MRQFGNLEMRQFGNLEMG